LKTIQRRDQCIRCARYRSAKSAGVQYGKQWSDRGTANRRLRKTNCPSWNGRHDAECLKAIAKHDDRIKERYQVASVEDILKEHKGDEKALAKAMKMRAALLDAIMRNQHAKAEPIAEPTPEPEPVKTPETKETTTMKHPIAVGDKITLVTISSMAFTTKHEVTVQKIDGPAFEFVPRGKRKAFRQCLSDKCIVINGWDGWLHTDLEGTCSRGNALINLTNRTGLQMQGVGGLGKAEPLLHSIERMRQMIEQDNVNPLLDKGLILVWTTDDHNSEPVVLFPEEAAKTAPNHAVLKDILEHQKEKPECTTALETTASLPPTPPAPIENAPVQAPSVAPVATTSSTASSQAHIETHVHQKKGFTYHIVVPRDRVSKTEWLRMAGLARDSKGWYGNKFGGVPGGYCFKEKAAATKFMADHFVGVNNMVESRQESSQNGGIPKHEKMGPLATCVIDRKPNVMHVASGAELYGPGMIRDEQHAQEVVHRLMSTGVMWELPLEKLQENPDIESIVTEALKEKVSSFSYQPAPVQTPEPEPAAVPESNVVKVDFSVPGVDLELQEALALAASL
jgi:hypothetical protein